MMTDQPGEDRDLVLSRYFEAPPSAVFRAWTQPDLLKQWFAPKPFTTPHVELDVRPGGSSLIVMRDASGQEFPNQGVDLEVEENKKLVFTNAYVRAWEPSAQPFVTVIVTFEAEGKGTRYTAQARHWTAADRQAHEAMGFHGGWNQCADQLAELLAAAPSTGAATSQGAGQ